MDNLAAAFSPKNTVITRLFLFSKIINENQITMRASQTPSLHS
jgi:hypothetical protein